MESWVRCQIIITSCLLMVTTLSCAQRRAQYLEEALNRVTQTEVTQRFGQPSDTHSLADGTNLWVYQIRGETAPPPQGDGEPYCEEYRLTFSEDTFLRQWEEHRC